MKQARLEGLADGIFAIVMTLLVLEIRVPELPALAHNADLLRALAGMLPSFASYALSFIVLFTYWRGHHHIASVFAKNIDNQLTNINAFFLLFVALIPFTTTLVGTHHNSQLAIGVYGLNIIIIGVLLYAMREYIYTSSTIRNALVSEKERINGSIRILLPVFSAAIAVAVSSVSTTLSLLLFTVAVIFNLSTRSTGFLNWCVTCGLRGVRKIFPA
jgi:uncharacterized membrane protein